MPNPQVLLRRLAWYSVVLLVLATARAGSAQATDLKTQREHFRQAYVLALQGNIRWKSYAGDLQDYPLSPYLQAAWLQARIRLVGAGLVTAYLDQYGDLLPGKALRRSWLNELTRRKDWAGYRRFYQPGLGVSYDCQALQARAGLGKSLHFDAKLKRIWSRAALPAACTPLLQLAHSEGLLSPVRLWARIDRATAVGKVATIRTLAIWLPKWQRAAALRFAQALTAPAVASKRAKGWPNTRHSRAAASLALQRLARNDATAAGQAYATLRRHLNFNRRQRARIKAALALFRATDFKPGALAALQALPKRAQSSVTWAWQVRVALAGQNWKVVRKVIARMPETQRQQREWQYFDARALAALGDEKVANARFVDLARQADYWGFLAADRIQAPYPLCPSKPALPHAALQAVQHVAGLARSFEWYALGNLPLARREWQAVWPQLRRTQRQAAVLLAHRRGWVDRAIFALGQGVERNDYALRFPVSFREQILSDSRVAGIDPVWTLSIIRAESAWSSDARSAANARGLMQLLPRTARQVAQRSGLPWKGAASLLNPVVNIGLGTRYLGQLAMRFGSQWLASAAYNAGAKPVAGWAEARGTLPADIFIATIPYRETRDYVESTLAFSVIYGWRLHGQPLRMSWRMPTVGGLYQLSDHDSPRGSVRCQASDRLAQGLPTSSREVVKPRSR